MAPITPSSSPSSSLSPTPRTRAGAAAEAGGRAEKYNYNPTHDPIAVFAFTLLILCILTFLYLLLITTRLSSQRIWDETHRVRERRKQEWIDEHLDFVGEDTNPLMALEARCKSKVIVMPSEDGRKSVRFSDVVDAREGCSVEK